MLYVITNGDKYLKTRDDNRWEVVKTLGEARVFDSRSKAQNCCLCLPANLRDRGYHVVDYEIDASAPPAERCVILHSQYAPAEQLNERVLDRQYILETVDRFEDFARMLRDQKPQLEQQLQFAEAQIFDIEHAAEFATLDASKGYKLYKMLHDARVLRRQCKDSLEMISYIEEVIDSDIYSKRTSRRITGLGLRSFTPRAIPDILEQIQS